VLVLDAIDECEPTAFNRLFRALLPKLSSIPHFRLFLTSRPNKRIARLLEGYDVHRIFAANSTKSAKPTAASARSSFQDLSDFDNEPSSAPKLDDVSDDDVRIPRHTVMSMSMAGEFKPNVMNLFLLETKLLVPDSNISEPDYYDTSPLDLSGLVRRVERKSVFNGTYSQVFIGKYGTKKVGLLYAPLGHSYT
jgi:hypothetical protein